MKVDLFCYWANGCSSCQDTVDVISYDDFIKNLTDFFEDACGFTGVESFSVVIGDEEYQWDNQDLPRRDDISDVWSDIEEDLEDFYYACAGTAKSEDKKTPEAKEPQSKLEDVEDPNVHWLIYSHEHNDWNKAKPQLVAIYSSYEAAKLKQKELLDEWAKNVCIDDEDETIVDYDIGKVMFKNSKDDYFQVDVKEFKNENKN